MSFYDRPQTVSASTVEVDQGLRSHMLRIYNYMASALILTGLVAYFSAQAAVTGGLDGPLTLTAFGQTILVSPLKWVVMLAPLGVVFFLSARLHHMSQGAAQAWFWAFAGIMGLSLTSVFLAFTGESIARVFFITAGAFGGLSLFGYSTKKDLSGWGSFLIMGVIGLVIASLVNLFLQSSAVSFAVSAIGVLIFAGLTAYDTQKLKVMYYQFAGNTAALGKMAVIGALELYLDFINLFMMLLRFAGDRR